MCVPTGAAIISMHYEDIQKRVGSVGVHVAVSATSRGKSNCAKVALAMAGNFPKGYAIYLTDSMARTYLSGALPFIYDDPSTDAVLKPLLMNSFGGAEISTQRHQFVARCSSIITVNEFVVDGLAKADARFVYIHILNIGVDNTSTVMHYHYFVKVSSESCAGAFCLQATTCHSRYARRHPAKGTSSYTRCNPDWPEPCRCQCIHITPDGSEDQGCSKGCWH